MTTQTLLLGDPAHVKRQPTNASLRVVRLVAAEPVSLRALYTEFPSIRFIQTRIANVRSGIIDARAWDAEVSSFESFDAEVTPRSALTIRDATEATVLQILTRYQRFVLRTNAASSDPRFSELRRIHPATARAVDTWQWLLRLDSDAGPAAQILAFAGEERAPQLALRVGYPRDVVRAIHELVAGRGDSALHDAAALSALSFERGSATDAALAMAQLGAAGRRKLAQVRFHDPAIVDEAASR